MPLMIIVIITAPPERDATATVR